MKTDSPDQKERFQNRKEALEWMRNQGVAISQGKFYQDCQTGMIVVYPDKTVGRASVLQYMMGLQRNAVIDPGIAELTIREQQLKVQKLELEVERLERGGRADDRRWMLREDSWALLAGVLGMLRHTLDYHVTKRAAALVEAIEGKPELAPQLVEQFTATVVNPAFNDLGGQTLQDACFAHMPDADNGDK